MHGRRNSSPSCMSWGPWRWSPLVALVVQATVASTHPRTALQLQQESMLRSPSLEEVRFYRDRAFEPWWDVLLFPRFQDVSIAPPKLTDLPLCIQLSFWSCTCLGGNVSAHFFPTQNTCYLPLRELFSLAKLDFRKALAWIEQVYAISKRFDMK